MAKKRRTKASATARTVSQLMAATMAVSPIVAALPILPGTAVAEEVLLDEGGSAPISVLMSGDADGRLGYLSTTVTVSRLTYAAETAQGIVGYRLYWADYSGIKRGDPIREWTGLTASSGDLNDVMDGVAIPDGATGLFVVPYTSEGAELDGISLGFTDIAAQTEAIESLSIEVVFNDEIAANSGTISATDFALTGADEIHVASAAIIGGRMQLVLSRAMVPGEALTLSYTPPTENKLVFANIGLYVPGFSGVAVYTGELPIIDDTDSAYPNVLHLVMTTPLDGIDADKNAFTVKRGNTPVDVQSVHVAGAVVTLTLEKTLMRNASYEVNYSPLHVNDLHRWSAYLPEFVATVTGPSDFPLPAGITVNKLADDYEFVVPNVPADASVAIYTTGASGAGYPIVTAPNVGTNEIHATVPIDSLASLNTVYIAFVENGFESARTPVQFNAAPVAKYTGWATLAAYSNGGDEKPPILLSLDNLFDDVDGDTLSYTYSYTGNPCVLHMDLVTGGLEFAPTYSPGTVVVTISADDHHGNQTSLNFSVTVGNDSPHASKGNAPGSAKIVAAVDSGEALQLVFSNQPFKQLPGLQSTLPEGAVAYTSGADITGADLRAKPYVGVYTVDALGKVLRFTPVTIDESMLQAGLFVTRTDGTALTLNGSQLDASIVRMNIFGNTYKWKTNIAAGDFVLNGAPEGMEIASVYRISDKVLDVKLAYTGSAIASPWNSLTITANASAFGAGGGSLTSDAIPIAPPAPAAAWQSSLKAAGGDGQATVAFFAPVGADSVTLEYADNPSFYGRQKQAVNPAVTSVGVSGLTNGQNYWFRLVASGGTQSGISNVEQINIGEPAPGAAGVPVIYTYEPLEGQEGTIAPGQSFKLQFNSLLDNRNGQAAEAIRQGLGSDFAGRIATQDGTDSGWSSQFTVIALDTISLTEGDHRIALAPGSVTNRSGRTNDDYIAFDIVGDWSDVRPVLDLGKIGFDQDDYYGTPQIYGQAGAVNQSGATIALYDWDGATDEGGKIDSSNNHLQQIAWAYSNEDGSFRFNIGSHDTSKQLVVVAQGRGGNYSSGFYDSYNETVYGIDPDVAKLVNKAVPFLTGEPVVQHVQQGSSFTLDVANYFADDDVLGYTFAGGYSTSVINSAYFIDNGKLSLLSGQNGTTAITVTATDMFGAQASQTFNLSVEESAPTALAASQVHYYPAAGTGDTIVISGLSSFWNKTVRVYDAAEGGRILSGDKLMGGEQAFDGTITYQLHEDLGAAGKDLWVTLTDYGWAESGRVQIDKQDRTHELTFVNSFNQAAGFKLNPAVTGTLRYLVLDSVDPVPSPTQIASGTDSEWESVEVSGSFNVTAGGDNEFYLLGLDPFAMKRIYAVITDDEGNISPVLTSFFYVREAGTVSVGWPDPYEVHSANEALFPYLMPGDLQLKKGDTLLLHFDRPVDSDTTAQKIASALDDMGWNGLYTVDALPVMPSSLAHTFRVHITGAITPMLPVSIELQGVQGFGDEYASEYISFMGITDYPEPELVADSTYSDAFHPITLTLPNIGSRLDQLPVGQQIQISFEPVMSEASFFEGDEGEGDDGLQFTARDKTITILPGQLPAGEWWISVTVPGYQKATVEQTIMDSYTVISDGGDFYVGTLSYIEGLQKLQLNGVDVTSDQYRLESKTYDQYEFLEVWLKHDYLATLPTGIYTLTTDFGGYEDSYPLSIFNPQAKIAHARGNATLAAEVTLQDLLDAGATAVTATRLDAYQAAIGLASAAETFDLTSLQELISDANDSLDSAEPPSPRIASAVLSSWQVAMLASEVVAALNPATIGPDSFTLIARDEAGNRLTPAAAHVHIESVRVESGSIVARLAGALGATDTVELRPNAMASNHFQNAEQVALTGTSGPLHLLPNVAPVVRELAIDAFGPVLEAQFYVEDDDGDVEGTHQIQWYRANEADGSLTPIAGANGSEYHPTAADLGKYIRVLVTPVSLTGVTTGVPVLSEAIQQSVLYSDIELSVNGLPEMEEMSGIPIPVYASVQSNFTFSGHVSGADAGEIAVVKLTIRERYGPYLRQTGEGEYSWVSGSDPLNEFEVPVDESGNWTWTLPNAALQRPDEYTRFIVTANAAAEGKLAQSGQGYFNVDYREPQLESANVYGNTIVLGYNQKLGVTSLGTNAFELFHFVIGKVDGIGGRTAHVIAASFYNNYLTLKFDTAAAVGETIEGGYTAPYSGGLSNWAGVPLGSFYEPEITNATADDFASASMPAADHNNGYLLESGEDVAVFRLAEEVSPGMTLEVQLPAEHAGNQTLLSQDLERDDFELLNAQDEIVAWAENPSNLATENEFGIRVLRFPLGGALNANETYTLRYVGQPGLVTLPHPASRADASLTIVNSFGFASLQHVFNGLSYGYPEHGPLSIAFTDLDTDAGQVKGTVSFTPALPSDESDIVDYAFYWLDQNGRIIDNGYGGEIASLAKDNDTSFEFYSNYPVPGGAVALAVYARNEYGLSRQFAVYSGFDNASGENVSPHAVVTMPDLLFESSSVTSSTMYVGNYFADVDDDYLIYSASSSDDAVVAFGTWAVSGSYITLTIAGSGTATVTITADDGHGHQFPQQFQVTVNAPALTGATTNRIGNVVQLVFNRPLASSWDTDKFHVYVGMSEVAINWAESGKDTVADNSGRTFAVALDGYVAASDTVTITLDAGAVTSMDGVPQGAINRQAVENRAAAPANAPWLVHFTDENKYAGSIQGAVSIGRAQDESDIEGYRLYWAKSDLTQVGATIATLPKSADPLAYLFDGDTTIPAQAARLVAVAINEQGESAPAYVELIDAAGMSFSGVSLNATSLGFTIPAASAGTAHVVVTDSDAWPWNLADILSGSHGGKQAIYTAVQPEVQAGDSIAVSLNELTPDTIYTVYVVVQAEDGSYSSIATSSFPLPPPAILGALQMIDASGAANDGKTEIVLGEPASGHSYLYKRWSGSSLMPHVGDLLAGADGWIAVQSGDLLEASNHELFAVAEVDGNGQMVGLSFVSAVVAKEPPALTADATDNNVDQPIELSFPDNADWRANVTSVTVKRHSDQAVVNAVYSVLESKVVLAKGTFAAGGEYDITVLANGYSPTNASQQVLGRSASPTEYTVSAVNALTGEDNVNVFEVPAYAEVRVYDAADAVTPIATKTQGSTSGVPVVLTFPGGFPSGLHVVYISLTNHANGLAESERMEYRLPLPVLVPPVSFTDAPGSASDGKTKAAIGSPSVAGHTFRYWKVTGTEIPFPVSGDKATGWSAIVNGQEFDAANGQYIIVVEVDDEDTIIAYSVSQAVVKEALASPNDTQITVENSLAAGAVDYVKVVNVPANTTVNVYSEGSGETKLGSAANVQTYAADVRVLINAGFEPLRTSFYVGYSRNGMEDSERTLQYVPTPQLSLTLADVEGIANDGTTKATVAGTGASGHKFYYKLSESALSGIGISSHIAAPEWQLLGGDGYIADATGLFVTIAETDADGNVVALAGRMAVVANALQAPAAGDIAVVNNASGEDTVTVANVPAGATVFVNESGGTRIGAAVNTDDSPATKQVAIAGGFVPLLAEIRVGFTKEGMEDSLPTSVALSLPALLEEPEFTYVRGSDNVVKSTIGLGELSGGGHKYRYVLSPDYSPVTPPVIGQSLDSWTEITDGETIAADSGRSIGIAEVDSADRAIRFSAGRVNTTRNPGMPITTGFVQKLTASGGYRTYINREDLPEDVRGFSKIEVQSWQTTPVVNDGITISDVNEYHEEYGYSVGVPSQGIWHPLVILFDANNHPVGYFIGSIDTTLPPALTVAPSAVDAGGSGNDGKTRIVLGAPSSGNAYRYVLANTGDTVDYPHAGDDATAWNELTLESWQDDLVSGLIVAAQAQQLGIAEVDGQGKVVRFSTVQAVTMDATPAPLSSDITLTNAAAGPDTVTVAGVLPHVQVKVYDAAIGDNVIGSAFQTEGSADSVTLSIASGFGADLRSVYVSLTNPNMEESERTEVSIPASLLPFTIADAPGAGNDGLAKVTIAANTEGHSYRYRVTSGTPLPRPAYVIDQDELEGSWTTLGLDRLVATEDGKYVNIVEVDESNRIVAFGSGIAVVIDALAAPTEGNIVISKTWNNGDSVTVANVPAGAFVYVYDTASGGTELGKALNNSGALGSVAVAFPSGLDPLLGAIYVELAQQGKETSERTVKAVAARPLTVSTADLPGLANNGKVQVTVADAPADAIVMYKVSASVLPQAQAGGAAGTGWTALGAAGAASGVVSGVAPGDRIYAAVLGESGTRYVAFGSVAAQVIDTLAVPAAADIAVANNVSGADTVTVANVSAGATVNVYGTASGGSMLGSATNGAAAGAVTVTIAGGLDPMLGTIYVELAQEGKETSQRTAVDVLSLPLAVTTADLSGAAYNGMTQVTVSGVPSGAVVVYRTGGVVVPQPQAGSAAGTGWTALGVAGATSGVVGGVAQGDLIQVAVLSGTQYVAYGSSTAVVIDALAAPAAADIAVVNNASGADTVTVANVPAGAFVYVYDAASGEMELGKASNTGTLAGSVAVAVQGGLSPLLGTIYVELRQTGKEASERTAKTVLAPLPVGAAQLSGSYEDSAKTVISLVTPSAAGNTYQYRLYSGTGDVQPPQAGASITAVGGSWQTATNGQAIAAAANQLIGIAEVDTSGRIVAFQVATAMHFQAAPSLQADTIDAFSDVPLEITTATGDTAALGWWTAAASGAVVTHTVGGVTYELSANQYGFSGSKLVIKAGVLAAGEHQIRVAVAGYTYANVALQSVGGPASEWALLNGVSGAAMAFQAANGAITAVAQLVSSQTLTADQSIAFELWDDAGTTGRVQLFAGGSSGPYTAQFSLQESSAGATYRIKVYVVSNRTDDAGGNDLKLSAPVELPVTMFRALDANGDGRIGINDLMAVVLHAPDSIRDVNHDGVFDREDVLALLRQIIDPGPGAGS
ncbi:hemoblobin-interacting domain-containing protein [Paenibacillus cymbidii]|uniref:hemoblobin-interacting domain-containing protein n=1 Tax=Paenibacillus cymbidii TaxID=1639034 RepID=UPI001436AB03|nr:SwmB domain-containing protein [Paenibacillus cymbidii]